MHNLILDNYANGEIVLPSKLLHLKGLAYKRMSNEERNLYKQEFVRSEEQKEERLSYTEKLVRRDFFRRIDLFHELGHCDLNRGHEDHNHSIMGRKFVSHINRIVSEEYPYIDLDDFFDSLMDELFSKRDTKYAIYNDNDGLFTKVLTFINQLNPWFTPGSEFVEFLRISLQDLNKLNEIMLTDEHFADNVLSHNDLEQHQ